MTVFHDFRNFMKIGDSIVEFDGEYNKYKYKLGVWFKSDKRAGLQVRGMEKWMNSAEKYRRERSEWQYHFLQLVAK